MPDFNADCKIEGCERESIDASGYCKKHKPVKTMKEYYRKLEPNENWQPGDKTLRDTLRPITPDEIPEYQLLTKNFQELFTTCQSWEARAEKADAACAAKDATILNLRNYVLPSEFIKSGAPSALSLDCGKAITEELAMWRASKGVVEMQQELERLRADKERLDYMDSSFIAADKVLRTHVFGKTGFREAIDAARALSSDSDEIIEVDKEGNARATTPSKP